MVREFFCVGKGVAEYKVWSGFGCCRGVWEGGEEVGGREAEVICCPCVLMLHNAT